MYSTYYPAVTCACHVMRAVLGCKLSCKLLLLYPGSSTPIGKVNHLLLGQPIRQCRPSHLDLVNAAFPQGAKGQTPDIDASSAMLGLPISIRSAQAFICLYVLLICPPFLPAPHRRCCNRRVAKSGRHPCNLRGMLCCGYKAMHRLVCCIDHLQNPLTASGFTGCGYNSSCRACARLYATSSNESNCIWTLGIDRAWLATGANYWPCENFEAPVTGREWSCVSSSHRGTAAGSRPPWQSMGLRALRPCSTPHMSIGWRQSPR